MVAASPGSPTEYRAILERVSDWSVETRSLFLRLATDVSLPFDPGQFVSLALPVGEYPPLVRAYSLASSPEDGGLLELCIDRVPGGAGSGYLFGLAPGAELALTGPFGSFKLGELPDTPSVFISHGTGIAPIRPMVRRALTRGGDQPIAVLQGGTSSLPLVYRDELAGLASAHRCLQWEAILAADGTAVTDNPRLEQVVRERYVEADAERARHFWICAVGALATRLRDLLRAAGYDRRAVRCEKW